MPPTEGVLSNLGLTNDEMMDIVTLERLNEIMDLTDRELPLLYESSDNNMINGPEREMMEAFSLLYECSNIKGYDSLSILGRRFFIEMYKKHQATLGKCLKDIWKAVSVKKFKDHLIVHFKNGEWLHYYSNGTWG